MKLKDIEKKIGTLSILVKCPRMRGVYLLNIVRQEVN